MKLLRGVVAEKSIRRKDYLSIMTGHKCCICGNTTSKDPSVPFHRFTKEPGKRALWSRVFQLREENISPNSRVCARHFPEGNEQPPTQSRYSMHLVWFAELSAWNITRAKSHFLYSVHFTNPTSKTASISATTPCRSFIRSSTDVPLSEVLHQSCKTRTYGIL